MSLQQLLKDAPETPKWSLQRRRLIRFLTGSAVMMGGFVLLAASFLTSTSYHAKAEHPSTAETQANSDNSDTAAKSEALTELMRLQQQAAELKEQIAEVQNAGKAPGGSRGRGGLPAPTMNYDPGAGFVELHKDAVEKYIPTGAVFQAQLLTPIKTSVERTFVMAEVTEEYRMDMARRIPKGARLVGRSHLNTVLKGVIVEFETLVLPNGIETNINGLALSRNALPEIDGLYFSNRETTYGTALAFGFLSGFADAGRTRQVSLLGAIPDVTVQNQVLGGLSTASFQVANEILNDIRQHAIEYVVVPAGERIFVALTRRYDVNQKGPTK